MNGGSLSAPMRKACRLSKKKIPSVNAPELEIVNQLALIIPPYSYTSDLLLSCSHLVCKPSLIHMSVSHSYRTLRLNYFYLDLHANLCHFFSTFLIILLFLSVAFLGVCGLVLIPRPQVGYPGVSPPPPTLSRLTATTSGGPACQLYVFVSPLMFVSNLRLQGMRIL